MSPVVRGTILLAGLLVVLIAADVAVMVSGPGEVAELPRLSELDPPEVRTVRIQRDGETIELTRIGDTGDWELVAPVEGPADGAALRDLVGRLRKGVPMQVRLEEGNLAEYGLQSGNALRLQVLEDGDEEPTIDLYIGGDTVGGASFVRFPDSEVVYRAQVGGRHRLDRPARDWRDPTIFDFEPSSASGLALQFGPEPLVFVERDGRWGLDGEPDFAVDQESVDKALERLSGMRAGRVLPSDFPLEGPPALRARVLREGLEPVEVRFWASGEVAYVTRDGRDEVFQVAASVPRRLAVPLPGWRDRQFFDLDRADIQTMTYRDRQQGTFVLEQDASDSRWRMIEPPNMDANLRESMQAAIQLAGLRVEGIAAVAPEAAGFPSETWIELAMRDGRTYRLELGLRTEQGETPLVFVRTPDQPERIGVIPLRQLLEIRRAWGR